MTQRAVLGDRLRRLRQARGLRLVDVCAGIGVSIATVSRMETGHRVRAESGHVRDLLSLYGITCSHQRRYLLSLLDPDRRSRWWDDYELPLWLETYLALEDTAAMIRTFDTQVVPPLLQTTDYAQAATRLAYPGLTSSEADLRAEILRHRKQELLRPDGPKLWAVIDEAALLRPVGGPRVHAAQLDALADALMEPNVTIQILRMHAPASGYLPVTGPFTVMRPHKLDRPDVIYLHQPLAAVPDDSDPDAYYEILSRLSVTAELPQRTQSALAEIRERVADGFAPGDVRG